MDRLNRECLVSAAKKMECCSTTRRRKRRVQKRPPKNDKSSSVRRVRNYSLLARALVAVALCYLWPARSAMGEVRSVSRVYHSACLERGQAYWDYENFQLSSLDWEDIDRYGVTGRLGFGRFSEALEGIAVDDGHKVVLKVLKPARTYKVKREIRVLQLLAGGPNVIGLEGVCRDRNIGTTTLILENLGDGVQWFGNILSNTSGKAGGDVIFKEASQKGVRPPASPGIDDQGGRGARRAASFIGPSRTDSSSTANPSIIVNSNSNSGTTAVSRKGVDEGGTLLEEDANTAMRQNSQRSNDSGQEGEIYRDEEGAAVGGRGIGMRAELRPSGVDGGNGVDGGSSRVEEEEEKECGRLSDYEVRLYLYKLLQALDFAHSRGVMHRDVKPRNVVINRRTRSLRLIDWGLGDFYIPGRRNMSRVGSRYYKAPELLVGFRFYDYAIDIFSVGCMLAGFLLNREPFFRGKNNDDQLLRIALVLGTQGLHDFLQKYDVTLEPRLLDMLGTHRKKPWNSIGGGAGGGGSADLAGCSPEGLDLLDRMLCYDHQDRISAGEALSHSFFDPVRGEAEACVGGGIPRVY